MKTSLTPRPFGSASLLVPALGFGAGGIGDPALQDADVRRLLHGVVDLGVTLIDTARSYGLSEERIGDILRERRQEILLSTKVGYGIEGYDDWTGPCVAAGVDAALRRLQTDVVDIVHLHSCPRETLERGDVVEALEAAVSAGKARVAAYSGDDEALEWAAASGRFGGLQASVNLFDQRALQMRPPANRGRRPGLIAKRALGNAPWRFENRPVGDEAEEYWQRWRAMALPRFDLPWAELALRFVVSQPCVDVALVGSRSLEHMRGHVEAIAKGPLPAEVVTAIREAYCRHGGGWRGKT
jgi:aryl-alcohol dehydrogenase-like predicted oxidoreductase